MPKTKHHINDKPAIIGALVTFVLGAFVMFQSDALFTSVLNTQDLDLEISINEQELTYQVISERSATLNEPGFVYVDVPVRISDLSGLGGAVRVQVEEQSAGNFQYASVIESANVPVQLFEQEKGMTTVIQAQDIDVSSVNILAVTNRYAENYQNLDYEIFMQLRISVEE